MSGLSWKIWPTYKNLSRVPMSQWSCSLYFVWKCGENLKDEVLGYGEIACRHLRMFFGQTSKRGCLKQKQGVIKTFYLRGSLTAVLDELEWDETRVKAIISNKPQ